MMKYLIAILATAYLLAGCNDKAETKLFGDDSRARFAYAYERYLICLGRVHVTEEYDMKEADTIRDREHIAYKAYHFARVICEEYLPKEKQ
jgi:hypothetical protein